MCVHVDWSVVMMLAKVILRSRRVRVLGLAAVLAVLLVLFHKNGRESLRVVDSPPSHRRNQSLLDDVSLEHEVSRRHQSLGEEVSPPSTHYTVYMRGMGGATGNQLFMFASLYGIARRNRRTPVMMCPGCR